MDWTEAKNISARCAHYGMCKVNFLGVGVCPRGIEHKYVSYYPQGRMEIFHALVEGIIPVTERVVDIAKSCTFCGICDKQCYFLMGLRPMKVMKALKTYIESYLAENMPVEKVAGDELLRDLQGVVGDEWATNDPAILVSYTRDLSPALPRRPSKYIVMPGSTQEVAEVVKIANKYRASFVTRGAGQLLLQKPHLGAGAAITVDTGRMKKIEIDPENWTATVQAGVTSFELQKGAEKYGLLADTAEPAASVCANITCTGLDSLFTHSYGIMANHFVDLEMVANEGKLYRFNEDPNFFSFGRPTEGAVAAPRGIVTQATVKLFPLAGDEEAIGVPFSRLDDGFAMLAEIGTRKIGLGASLMSLNFFTMFASPTFDASHELKCFLQDRLGVEYLLMVLGDKYAMSAIRQMAEVTVDQRLARTFMLGVTELYQEAGLELLSRVEGSQEPFKALFQPELLPLWEILLSPSPENLARAVDEDMKDFYRELYSRPEMTDLFWLNRFRPLSARMGRNHAVFATGLFFPLRREIVDELCTTMRAIGDKHGVLNDLGFIVPLEQGKKGRMEWDFFFDQTDEQSRRTSEKVQIEVSQTNEMLAGKIKSLKPFEWIMNQGFARQDSFLYT